MCRFAAHRGPARPLSTLLYDPPHSLSHQAWAPREMLFGNVNVDGTGVAWWPAGDAPGDPAEPLRYVTSAAPWNDVNLPSLSRRIASPLALAAVRSATPGIPFGPANAHPFTVGRLALAHNGFVQGFRTGVGRRLLERLSDASFGAMDALSDSLALLLLVRDHVAGGAALPEAVAATVALVADVVRAAGQGATLNLLVADGEALVATRTSVDLGQNSLYLCRDDGVLVASEPLDDDRDWQAVPEQTLLVAGDDGVELHDL